ncbi:hypothetical protein ACVW0Y_001112 [Pseudomonas sp. TE3786]
MSSFSVAEQLQRHNASSRTTAPVPQASPAEGKSQLPGACACGGGCPRCRHKQPLQAKLSVSQPGDRYEQEADRVAAQVMASPSAPQLTAPVQIQRLATSSGEHAQAVPDSVEQTLAGSGRPLEPAVRESMEQRFGHSFADVQLHLGGQAQQSARDVGAEAYTVGRNLVFDAGKYAPQTSAGQHLLAHELTHVLQQTGPAAGVGAQRMLARYRNPKSKNSIAFEGADETLTDSKNQPWIAHIDVAFTGAAVDTGHVADAKAAGDPQVPRMPTGTLTATYSAKSSTTPGPLSVPIVGGSTMRGIGLTDKVTNNKVSRMEGSGYTDSDNVSSGNLSDPVATKGWGSRYSKSGDGTMNYAIFFAGPQAIHEGALDTGSHACVHVEDHDKMRTLNHHTWRGKTTVTVTYTDATAKDLCCTRKANGNPGWKNNPCKGTSCP